MDKVIFAGHTFDLDYLNELSNEIEKKIKNSTDVETTKQLINELNEIVTLEQFVCNQVNMRINSLEDTKHDRTGEKSNEYLQ